MSFAALFGGKAATAAAQSVQKWKQLFQVDEQIDLQREQLKFQREQLATTVEMQDDQQAHEVSLQAAQRNSAAQLEQARARNNRLLEELRQRHADSTLTRQIAVTIGTEMAEHIGEVPYEQAMEALSGLEETGNPMLGLNRMLVRQGLYRNPQEGLEVLDRFTNDLSYRPTWVTIEQAYNVAQDIAQATPEEREAGLKELRTEWDARGEEQQEARDIELEHLRETVTNLRANTGLQTSQAEVAAANARYLDAGTEARIQQMGFDAEAQPLVLAEMANNNRLLELNANRAQIENGFLPMQIRASLDNLWAQTKQLENANEEWALTLDDRVRAIAANADIQESEARFMVATEEFRTALAENDVERAHATLRLLELEEEQVSANIDLIRANTDAQLTQTARTLWEQENLDPARLDALRAEIRSTDAGTRMTEEQILREIWQRENLDPAQLDALVTQTEGAEFANMEARLSLVNDLMENGRTEQIVALAPEILSPLGLSPEEMDQVVGQLTEIGASRLNNMQKIEQAQVVIALAESRSAEAQATIDEYNAENVATQYADDQELKWFNANTNRIQANAYAQQASRAGSGSGSGSINDAHKAVKDATGISLQDVHDRVSEYNQKNAEYQYAAAVVQGGVPAEIQALAQEAGYAPENLQAYVARLQQEVLDMQGIVGATFGTYYDAMVSETGQPYLDPKMFGLTQDHPIFLSTLGNYSWFQGAVEEQTAEDQLVRDSVFAAIDAAAPRMDPATSGLAGSRIVYDQLVEEHGVEALARNGVTGPADIAPLLTQEASEFHNQLGTAQEAISTVSPDLDVTSREDRSEAGRVLNERNRTLHGYADQLSGYGARNLNPQEQYDLGQLMVQWGFAPNVLQDAGIMDPVGRIQNPQAAIDFIRREQTRIAQQIDSLIYMHSRE